MCRVRGFGIDRVKAKDEEREQERNEPGVSKGQTLEATEVRFGFATFRDSRRFVCCALYVARVVSTLVND